MELKIYLDRIRDGQTELFQETIPSALLLSEPDITFDETIQMSGKAYLAGDHVVLQLQAKTTAWLPCSICNKPTKVPLELSHFYHTEPIENFTSGVFDFSSLLREDLLLELPLFTECIKNQCPERATLEKYSKSANKNPSPSVQFPFAEL